MDLTSESVPIQDTHEYLSTTVHEGKACISNNAKFEETKSDATQAAERIRAFYTKGVPFFTKAAIADLAGQLDRARKQYQREDAPEGRNEGNRYVQMFSLKALDGKTVEIKNRLGLARPTGVASERVCVDFSIHYQTYQDMILHNKDPDGFFDELGYCPLLVHYRARERWTDTMEFWPEPETNSLETTQLAFHRGVKAWKDSKECKKLTDALMINTIPDKITKIIAFACGTISGHVRDEEIIMQHALILTVKDIVQKKKPTGDGEIKCYAQDPVYTEVDRAVLEGAGVQILEDPYGFLEVDDSSVVISFAPNVAVRQIVADIAHPAIMIWNKVIPEEEMVQSWSEGWEERTFESVEELEGNICDPESSRLREMTQNKYIEIHGLSENTFGDSCVYVRRCLDT